MDDSDVDVDLPIPYDDVDLPAYYEGKLPTENQEPSLMQGFVALTALYKIAGWSFLSWDSVGVDDLFRESAATCIRYR